MHVLPGEITSDPTVAQCLPGRRALLGFVNVPQPVITPILCRNIGIS